MKSLKFVGRYKATLLTDELQALPFWTRTDWRPEGASTIIAREIIIWYREGVLKDIEVIVHAHDPDEESWQEKNIRLRSSAKAKLVALGLTEEESNALNPSAVRLKEERP